VAKKGKKVKNNFVYFACPELARSEPVRGELACPELAEGVELVERVVKNLKSEIGNLKSIPIPTRKNGSFKGE
jgi:hypothetical protein